MNNAQIMAKENITWRQAYYALLSGKKIKRPAWKGYWCFEKSPRGDNSIMMHTMEGDTIDIRDSVNTPYTFENTVMKDWMVVEYTDRD